MTATTRPACVHLVGKYLVENGQLFQKEQISFCDDINNSLSNVNDFNISYSYSDNNVTTTETDSTSVNHITQSNSQSVSESSSTNNTEQLNCNGDDDDCNEDNDILNERSGSFENMFTSPDFVEDVERTTVYSHIDSGQCDKVYTFAPAEGNKPMSIFLDIFS